MHNEQVFTPSWVVELMLNRVGYIPSEDIYKKHIVDNSCGEGAFLCEIADRYIKHCIINSKSREDVVIGLETYIHGIEIDTNLCSVTRKNLNAVAAKYSISNVKWDIVNKDAVDCLKTHQQMDYVVGNPPYCKIHDIPQEKRERYKNICYKSKGTFDSYVMFFWIGIKMLGSYGKLIYITPSSWTTSLYAEYFREWLTEKHGIVSVIDMQHKKVFDNATTFTMITELGNWWHNNNTTKVYSMNENDTCNLINDTDLFNYVVGKRNNFYFKDKTTVEALKKIYWQDDIEEIFKVKNGFATLNDKLFIGSLSEMAGFLGDPNMIFCTKASKNILQSIIYPYDKEGKPLKFEELSIPVQNILLRRAYGLKVDTSKENWYLYGRSQAINDVNKNKYAINNLIKAREDIKLHYCCSETGIYSGFYILSKDDFRNRETRQFIEETINNDDFVNYVHSLGRYKNGGFSTFTTKELEKYLNFKWKERKISF